MSKREAAQQLTEQLESHKAFPKHRCLLRQREVSHFQTSPQVQDIWDPRSDTVNCRVSPGLLHARFLSHDAPNGGQGRSRRWEEDLGGGSRFARVLAEVLLREARNLIYIPLSGP